MGVLTDFIPENREVKVSETAGVTVSGLTLADLGVLVRDHSDVVGALFEGNLNVTSLLTEAPDVAALIIATVCGEPEAVDNCKKLPMSVQLAILVAAWDLTIVDEESLKKLVGRLETLVESVKPREGLKQPRIATPRKSKATKA